MSSLSLVHPLRNLLAVLRCSSDLVASARARTLPAAVAATSPVALAFFPSSLPLPFGHRRFVACVIIG